MTVNRILTRTAMLKSGVASIASSAGVLALSRSVSLAASAPVVETTHGKLRGTATGGVYAFKGIRYGATTAGANRFRPPQPVVPWAGIRDAVELGHAAPQLPGSLSPINRWYNLITPMSEDCLFLNVFTPGLNAGGRRPIMVWLHGGLWENASGGAPGFDGTNMARGGDVVVVTLNHRINLFGYLHIGGKDERFADAANAGVLDMVAALRWVRDNADAFGGDRNNVTIFGQSGGAAKVTALMGMPAAHGLFHKAIAESCSGGLRLDTIDGAERKMQTLAQRVGLSHATGPQLQAVPMDDLLAAFNSMGPPGQPSRAYNLPKYSGLAAFPKVVDPQFRPVMDHRNFHRDPFDPNAPPLSAHVPFMMGNAGSEISLWLAEDEKNFSLTESDVRGRLKDFWHIDNGAAAYIYDAYRSVQPAAAPNDLLIDITTDYVYRRNATVGEDLKSRQQAPVYAYVFNWKTPVLGGRLRSPHTIEVPFAFGTTDAAAALVGTGPDVATMTRATMGAWVAFARTGDPSNAALPAWPRYTAARRPTMMLELESHVVDNPGGDLRGIFEPFPLYDFAMPRNFIR
jgi:para-nitrobenzyl esterase